MKVIVKGGIVDYVPFFNAGIKEGKLIITKKGDLSLTVDTGFSGGVALPTNLLKNLHLEMAFYDTFKLATGEIVELPVFTGEVTIGRKEVETWFIPGDYLLGMEFLSSAGSVLFLDFAKNKVSLLG